MPVGGAFPYVGVSATGTADTAAAKAKASPTPDGTLRQQLGLANLTGRSSAGAGTGTASASPSASPSPSASTSPSPSASPSASPSPSASTSAPAKPSAAPAPSTKAPQKSTAAAAPVPAPSKPAAPVPAPSKPAAPATRPSLDGHSAEETAVVALVNLERAQAGCGPVRANPPLAALAGAFSKDMATRGFFGHDDPDGNTPWDRASQAGLSGLGGENIARGQGDADAVMKAWMNSPGHKANILNCEFRTLGVGAHFAVGGPWWTQEFGF